MIKNKKCLYINNNAFKYNDNIYYNDALYCVFIFE